MFQKATKKNSKLRLAISGPSGSGKTFSALRIAKGLSSKIAFIDTEFKTASKYSDQFDFDVIDLSNETPIEKFIEAINFAGSNGYEVLIIDSMSHVWDSMLDTIEKVAKAKYSGNTFAAWKDRAGGRLQTDFINSILKSQCHVISCFRVKTEWVMEANEKGKLQPKRVGMGTKQRDGIEYEFDMLLEGNIDHIFTCTKDRSTGKFQDKFFEKPSEELGKELLEWLNTGIPEEKHPEIKSPTSQPDKNLLSETLTEFEYRFDETNKLHVISTPDGEYKTSDNTIGDKAKDVIINSTIITVKFMKIPKGFKLIDVEKAVA